MSANAHALLSEHSPATLYSKPSDVDVQLCLFLEGQGTFGGEVKGCSSAACLVTPVDRALTVGVLVIVEHAVSVLTGVPVLAKGHQGNSAVDVLPYCLTSCIPTEVSEHEAAST